VNFVQTGIVCIYIGTASNAMTSRSVIKLEHFAYLAPEDLSCLESKVMAYNQNKRDID
jgi:hypothetical protein